MCAALLINGIAPEAVAICVTGNANHAVAARPSTVTTRRKIKKAKAWAKPTDMVGMRRRSAKRRTVRDDPFCDHVRFAASDGGQAIGSRAFVIISHV
jgi:hypothetical protein